MTAIFKIGKDGNGTVYAGRSEEEIKKLVRDYEKCGWTVTYAGTNKELGQVWYEIS